jgi:hypothetical protein
MNPSSRSAAFRHAPIVGSPGDEVVEEILVEIMVS